MKSKLILTILAAGLPGSFSLLAADRPVPESAVNPSEPTSAVSWFGYPHYRGQGLVIPLDDFPERVPRSTDRWFAPRYLPKGPPLAIDPVGDATHTLNSFKSDNAEPSKVWEALKQRYLKQAKGELTGKGGDKATEKDKTLLLSPMEHLETLVGVDGSGITQSTENYLNPIVRLEPGRDAVLLRLRREFQYVNEDVPGMEAVWNRDNIVDTDGWQIRGALMADVYLDSLYNMPTKPWFYGNDGTSAYPRSLFFRFGAEWDYNDMVSTAQTDTRRFYMMASMWMNQDNWAFDGAQFVQAGAIYEQDALLGVDQWRWTFSWEPRISTHASEKGKANAANEADEAVLPFALGTKNFFGHGRHFWYINPKLDYSAVQQAIQQRDFASLGDLQVGASVDAGLSLYHGTFELRYSARSYCSTSDWGDSHTYQEARLDFWPGKGLRENSFTDSMIRAPRYFVSYRYGEDAPAYTKVDFFSAGVSLRF